MCAGLPERNDRPDDKLPYAGAWLQLGPEMLHLMELNNPDAGIPRPEHGGRDRHFCVGMGEDGVKVLCETLDKQGACAASVPIVRSTDRIAFAADCQGQRAPRLPLLPACPQERALCST